MTEQTRAMTRRSAPLLVFAAAVVLALVAILGSVWVGIPGPDNSLRLDSPYAPVALDLGERCNSFSCQRRITYEMMDHGTEQRTPCRFDLDLNKPAFLDVAAHWASNGKSITLQFGAATDKEHTLTINFARDCSRN